MAAFRRDAPFRAVRHAMAGKLRASRIKSGALTQYKDAARDL